MTATHFWETNVSLLELFTHGFPWELLWCGYTWVAQRWCFQLYLNGAVWIPNSFNKAFMDSFPLVLCDGMNVKHQKRADVSWVQLLTAWLMALYTSWVTHLMCCRVHTIGHSKYKPDEKHANQWQDHQLNHVTSIEGRGNRIDENEGRKGLNAFHLSTIMNWRFIYVTVLFIQKGVSMIYG